ncbi:transcriptional regulator with XRE-family HTH domain [Kitasatospora sp. MAP12-15]|uniref:helix-turn-helix domain-containing protein n=1 Tax=unclassified Kitasatospora TaxID=2633591 RepID=UPI0024737EA4|nr:helix-turn-helix transcriptional regulator [Kitasatospora sp. MAP12-44]MDH6113455.1 transcriptional regulator with XRE-family HTH domain [Kitasatospora sp. MAP12-44]
MRRSRTPAPTPVPFSPQAARAHRAGLGLTPDQVAAGMAAHGVRLLPTHVLGWEGGVIRPTEEEFIALARALWCPAVQLMGVRPDSLRDFRVARELSQEQTARQLGLGLTSYQAAELSGRWKGDEAQTLALAQVLGLTLRDVIRVTGVAEELDQRLRQCVDGRWQAQLKAVGRLVPAPRDTLAGVLAALQGEYQVNSYWGSSTPDDQQPPAEPLEQRFWTLLAAAGTDIPV